MVMHNLSATLIWFTITSYQICQICDAFATRPLHTARPSLLPSALAGPQRASRCAARLPHVPREPVPDRRRTLDGVRWLASTSDTRPGVASEDPATPRPSKPELSSLTDMMAFLANSTSKVTARDKIPSEADVSAALRACKVVADYITDESSSFSQELPGKQTPLDHFDISHSILSHACITFCYCNGLLLF